VGISRWVPAYGGLAITQGAFYKVL